MKLALLTVAVLTVCANELVLGVLKERDAMEASCVTPVTWRETLADLLAPVLELLYIVALPLAFAALLCALCVFAASQGPVLLLSLLILATGWLLRR
ncbi:MAG: hypothetical protein JO203_14790 [Gammaproteobacteria bacterium]|nr:hypothetical protein [Gammaproteobacteria bacterium]